jgi:hypothetical protein
MKTLRSVRRSVRRLCPDHIGRMQRVRRHDEQSGSRDDSGAVLVLALVFLVTVSVIVGALTDWVSNDLMNSQSFGATQTLNNEATNAVNLGVQSIRYTPLLYNAATVTDQTLNASPPSYCWGTGPSQAFNMNVYCSTIWNPQSASTRKVTVSACPTARTAPVTGTASWTSAQNTCAASPLLQAIVTFDDYPPTGVSSPNQTQCVTYCGSTLNINSWNWNPTVPTVTNVVGLSGNFDGGAPITITGTGFGAGSTVNFVDSNPLAQINSPTIQQIVSAPIVGTPTATSIQATSPSITTLADYYITVTNASGQTSAVMPNATCNANPTLAVGCFIYATTAPTVSGVTPISGYTTHSTAITITGSGFVNGTTTDPTQTVTVTMVQDNGGVPNYAVEGVATAVQVVSNSKITALTYPFTTLNQAFFIQVTTPSAGASTLPNSAIFTFTQAPP